MGFPGGSDGKESACNVGDLGSIPGLGRCPGGGHVNPLQYSCLKDPHGQRSLRATVRGFAKNQTRLTKHTHTQIRTASELQINHSDMMAEFTRGEEITKEQSTKRKPTEFYRIQNRVQKSLRRRKHPHFGRWTVNALESWVSPEQTV